MEEEKVLPLTPEQELIQAKKNAVQLARDRNVEYVDLVSKFDEMIETYDTLISVVTENKSRFKKYDDMIAQFKATKISYSTQRRNIAARNKRLEKILKNPDFHTMQEILSCLKIQ